ncbi:DinB family protein [Nonomuraea fastidiosa]|jgi:hypothetical protein|uniref:DinB family protein n=1 Tax=Nonomuraea TaxID=83681 RepID=UPI0032527BE7
MSELQRLRWQLDVSWSLLTFQLNGLTDEEALREPSSNCWSVRRKPDGTWAADWSMPEPDPAPATSIAWVMWHIGFWWTHAYTRCFDKPDAAPEPDDWSAAAQATPWPGDVASAVTWLNECRDRWSHALDSLSGTDLDSTDRSGWFADGTLTLGHVVAWVNIELAKNAAEIGLLRRQ